jgi:hypothetical protein
VGEDARRIRRVAGVPVLTRVRRGAYVRTDVWRASRPEERHRWLIDATVASMRIAPVLSHESAAVLHGLPLVGPLPRTLQVVAEAAGGGRSSGLVRRHGVVRLPETIEVDGMAVTTVPETVVALARTRSFASALAAADHALATRMTTIEDLAAALQRAGSARGTRRATKVLRWADGRSESVGESVSREHIIILGLPVPELQHSFDDAHGFIGRVDFWWESERVAGEFDGRTKYRAGSHGLRASEAVLWEEKRREDRLRRLGLTVVRWVWDEALDVERLRRILADAGIISARRR